MQSNSPNIFAKVIQINLILLLTIISSCVSTKVTDEFNTKKESKILLVIDKADEVEKKKEIGLLFTRYLDYVPADDVLLRTVNEYVPYELYDLGYKNVIYKEDLAINNDNLSQFDFIAEIKLKDFMVKEYKFKEQVSDSASGKTDAVKLHGVKTKLEASVFSISSKSGDNYAKNASASRSDDESQEGEFKNTVGLKDIVNKDKDGSIKYKHTVTPLPNGLFENQCKSVSYSLAKDISDKLFISLQKRNERQEEKNSALNMLNLFNEINDASLNLLPEGGTVNYFGKILSEKEANSYYEKLLSNIAWKNDEAVIYGKRIITARKAAWYGNKEYNYTYSNTTKQALPWTEELMQLKQLIEEKTSESFNSCLLNLYHNGDEAMAWHSDGEKTLKENGAIASMSFGAERLFQFKHKQNNKQIQLLLEHGSLLIMKDETQKYWLHRLAKSSKIKTPRVNLTFRTIVGQ